MDAVDAVQAARCKSFSAIQLDSLARLWLRRTDSSFALALKPLLMEAARTRLKVETAGGALELVLYCRFPTARVSELIQGYINLCREP